MAELHYCITVLDTSGIQDYVFGSNDLQHIIAASALVHACTHEWVFETLNAQGKTNISPDGVYDTKVTFEQDALDSELIYSGGGNTVIIFKSTETAEKFTRVLSRQVLLQAPGLQLVVGTSREYTWNDRIHPLRDVVQQAMQITGRRKLARKRSTPLLGLGVTADCQFTGLPAIDTGRDGRRLSAEIKAKLQFYNKAEKRLRQVIPSEYSNFKEFAKNFDEIGEKGRSSYLSVTHIDGNGMAKRIREVTGRPACAENRAYISQIRTFSISIESASQEALRAVTLEVTKNDDGKIGGEVTVRENTVPFRPIVFGGDDVTFVCDGRLGLTLTQVFLEKLTSYRLNTDSNNSQGTEPPISARAGIAIVKTHFPFSQAYKLATQLEGNAKDFHKQLKKELNKDATTMDWHFSTGGLTLDIRDIRKQEFSVPAGYLCMRPVHLGDGYNWRSWENFARQTRNLKNQAKEQNNKIMGLRIIARNGSEAVKNYLHVGKCPELILPIQGWLDSEKTGWVEGTCTFFDAIEAMDFFVDFQKEPEHA